MILNDFSSFISKRKKSQNFLKLFVSHESQKRFAIFSENIFTFGKFGGENEMPKMPHPQPLREKKKREFVNNKKKRKKEIHHKPMEC